MCMVFRRAEQPLSGTGASNIVLWEWGALIKVYSSGGSVGMLVPENTRSVSATDSSLHHWSQPSPETSPPLCKTQLRCKKSMPDSSCCIKHLTCTAIGCQELQNEVPAWEQGWMHTKSKSCVHDMRQVHPPPQSGQRLCPPGLC